MIKNIFDQDNNFDHKIIVDQIFFDHDQKYF